MPFGQSTNGRKILLIALLLLVSASAAGCRCNAPSSRSSSPDSAHQLSIEAVPAALFRTWQQVGEFGKITLTLRPDNSFEYERVLPQHPQSTHLSGSMTIVGRELWFRFAQSSDEIGGGCEVYCNHREDRLLCEDTNCALPNPIVFRGPFR